MRRTARTRAHAHTLTHARTHNNHFTHNISAAPNARYTLRTPPLLSPRFFLLCFFTCFTVFWYNIATHLIGDRWLKMFAEARTRNKGRLQWIWVSPLPPTPPPKPEVPAVGLEVRSVNSSPPAAASAAATPATSATPPPAAAPAAAPAKPKPGYFFAVLSEAFQDRWDIFFGLPVLVSSFIVGSCVIFLGPSSTLQLSAL